MGSSEDDAALVARTVAGDRAAFGVLVERYAGQARRVARAVLGDPDDADDAAQDGFLSALVKLAQYDARRPFGPWLMRIVANAATDRRRRRTVRRAEPLDPSLVGGGPRPDAIAVRSELGAALRSALEPKDDHAAFVARVMARYDQALARAMIPTLDVLASWFRPGIAAAAAALIAGFLLGRAVLAPAPTSFDAALAPVEGPGLAALVTAPDPPDASVVFTSLVEQR